MELSNITFPFRNWAYNTLPKFFSIESIQDFANSNKAIDEWTSENTNVHFYINRLQSFENELLQIIDTTTQETINYYFETLLEDIHYIEDLLTIDYLFDLISEYNFSEQVKYRELVDKKTEEYFKDPDRKRKHLEEFETYILPRHNFFPLLPFERKQDFESARKIKKTNYNFFCIEDVPKSIDLSLVNDYFKFLKEQSDLFVGIAIKYGKPWREGKIKSKSISKALKPILFCEGDIDAELIEKAAELFDKLDLISRIEIRYRSGSSNLDKLWAVLITDNWETVPQKKILLYDCDTNKPNDDFGHIHRRTIPQIVGHRVQRGIENLFPNETIEKALKFKVEFFDSKTTIGTERGVPYSIAEFSINKHEKRNFCNWAIEFGTREDFKHFEVIFKIIESLI